MARPRRSAPHRGPPLPREDPPSLVPPTLRRLWWLAAPLLALAAYRTVTDAEFVGDAGFLIRDNLHIRDAARLWDHATHNYFWSSSGNAIPYWRPVTKVSWLLEYRLFGPNPAGFMLVQLAWHVLGILGVQRLGRQSGLSPLWAALAATVFALHPVARDPVCMLMARSDVASAAAAVWAVSLWWTWRETAKPRYLAAHAVAFAAALLSKESAIAVPLILAGLEVAGLARVATTSAAPARTSTSRVLALAFAPSLVLIVLWWIARRTILRRDAEGMEAVGVSFDPLRIFASLSAYLHGLFPLSLRSTLRDIPVAEARSGQFLAVGILTFGVVAALLVWAWRKRDKTALWLAAWFFAALAPVVLTTSILVPGGAEKFSLADRWLFHGLAPSVVLGAWLLQSLPWVRVRQGAQAAIVVWTALILWDSKEANAELITEAGMLDNEDRVLFHGTPERFRTQEDWCRFEDRKIVRALMRRDPAGVVRAGQGAVARCGDSPERDMWRLGALVDLQRWKDAEPIALRLLRSPPRDRRGHASLALQVGRVLLITGHPVEAEEALAAATQLGAQPCEIFILLAETARATGRVALAAQRLEAAYECGGKRDASLLLAGCTWLVQAGNLGAARPLLERAEKANLAAGEREQALLLRRALDGDRTALDQLGNAIPQ